MRTFPLVFCRGGSKGIRRKNLRSINGRSLLERSVSHGLMLSSKCFVSTDSDEIANEARLLGAEVIARPDYLATDESPEILSWKHACESIPIGDDDLFVSLPTTAPLREFDTILKAIELFMDGDADIICAASEADRNPFLNMFNLSEGLLVPLTNELNWRRQDSRTVLSVSTVVYVTNGRYIRETEMPFSGRVKPIIISRYESVDIDTEDDLMLAEAFENMRTAQSVIE